MNEKNYFDRFADVSCLASNTSKAKTLMYRFISFNDTHK